MLHVPWDSPLVQHLPTSWWPAWQPSHLFHIPARHWWNSKPGAIMPPFTVWDQADVLPTELSNFLPCPVQEVVCLYHCYMVKFPVNLCLWYMSYLQYYLTWFQKSQDVFFEYVQRDNELAIHETIKNLYEPQKWHSVWLMEIPFYLWKVDHPSYWWKQYLSHLLDKFILWSIVDFLPYFFYFSKLRNK